MKFDLFTAKAPPLFGLDISSSSVKMLELVDAGKIKAIGVSTPRRSATETSSTTTLPLKARRKPRATSQSSLP